MSTTIEIILLTLNCVLFLYLAFFKSYFSEKGKQLALKEDIHEITKTVEGIKSEFIRETEKIKSELQLLLQNEFSIANETRNTILCFQEKYSTWLNTISSIFPEVLTDKESAQKYKEKYEQNLDDSKLKFEITSDKTELFLHDKTFFELKTALTEATIKYEQPVRTLLTNTEYFAKSFEIVKIYSNLEEQKSKTEAIHNEIRKNSEEFRKQTLELYPAVIKQHHLLTNYLREQFSLTINKNK